MIGHFWILPVAIGLLTAVRAADSRPDDSRALAAALHEMPKPWVGTPNRFTLAEYQATLRYWQEKYRPIFSYEQRGATPAGLPLYLLRITDPAVPDDAKQHPLIVALHSGPERSGTDSILRFAEWLLGDSALARETRRKQLVLLMPMLNADSFFDPSGEAPALNSRGLNVYSGRERVFHLADDQGSTASIWDMQTVKLKHPEAAPEIAAYVSVVDQYCPEVEADMHGVDVRYNGQLVFQSVGAAGSNYSLRPWDWRFTELMRRAAEGEGYGSSRWEADTQRSLGAGELFEAQTAKLYYGRSSFYNESYAYFHCHTLLELNEIGWPEGGAALLRGMMQIGNRKWYDARYEGYPVDRLKSDSSNTFITAWGRNAGERRASRTELWNRQKGLLLASLYPETEGRHVWFCAVNEKGRQLLGGTEIDARREVGEAPSAFLAKIGAEPAFDAGVLADIIKAGPETFIRADRNDNVAGPALAAPIEHGIGFRFRVNYRDARILDLRLNGRSLPLSDTDGYRSWFADGWTQIQINLPPERARTADLFVVSLIYRGDEARTYGWRPPAAVGRR